MRKITTANKQVVYCCNKLRAGTCFYSGKDIAPEFLWSSLEHYVKELDRKYLLLCKRFEALARAYKELLNDKVS